MADRLTVAVRTLSDHTLVRVRWASVAITVVGAALSIYYVIRIAHIGAEAAWSRVSSS